MLRSLLKSKIHRVKVTETELNYEGSITVDENLMESADILPGEELLILNLNNGARFTTYAIVGERNSGIICLNGPSARRVQVDDEIIILSYALFEEKEITHYHPKIVKVDKHNKEIR